MAEGRNDTKNKILEISLQHFARFGYAGTNLELIGKEAGLTRGPLYYYFKNKKELYLAAVDYELKRLMENYRRIFEQDASIFEKLREDVEYCCGHETLIAQIGSGGKEEPPVSGYERFCQELYQLKKEAIQKGQQDKELTLSANADEMTAFLYIYCYGLKDFQALNTCRHFQDPENLNRFAEMFVELFKARYKA